MLQGLGVISPMEFIHSSLVQVLDALTATLLMKIFLPPRSLERCVIIVDKALKIDLAGEHSIMS
jgi:hypothetical protein